MTQNTKVYMEQGGDSLAVKGKDGGMIKGQATAGAAPAQAAKINDPSGGSTVDTQARTAIAAIIDVLENAGLTASS